MSNAYCVRCQKHIIGTAELPNEDEVVWDTEDRPWCRMCQQAVLGVWRPGDEASLQEIMRRDQTDMATQMDKLADANDYLVKALGVIAFLAEDDKAVTIVVDKTLKKLGETS